MCSYEKASWPGYRDLANRAGNFPHMNIPAQIPGLSETKHFQLRMACKAADMWERGSTGTGGPYEQKTKFVPPTGPTRLPGSLEKALNVCRLRWLKDDLDKLIDKKRFFFFFFASLTSSFSLLLFIMRH